VTDELKAKLKAAANANQRSISEEIEHQLEMSFMRDDLMLIIGRALSNSSQ